MWKILLVFQMFLAVCLSRSLQNDFLFQTKRGGRIAGGTEAKRYQFPYQVAIFTYAATSTICGGSILSPLWVLTAAHCFGNFESADIIGGVHNVEQDDALYELEVFPNDIVNHPQYNGTLHSNDVSLVKTSRKPITFSSAIQPISLISRSMASTDLSGQTGLVAGWGRTTDANRQTSSKLFYIEAPILPNSDCSRTYGNIITASNVCLSGKNAQSTCEGDSGSPLTIFYAGKQVQVGIVSFGSENGCQLGHPTVFARVSSFHSWIQSTTGITIN